MGLVLALALSWRQEWEERNSAVPGGLGRRYGDGYGERVKDRDREGGRLRWSWGVGGGERKALGRGVYGILRLVGKAGMERGKR